MEPTVPDRTLDRVIFAVAVALVNDRSEWLIAQRPKGTVMANHWEFPGGKMKIAETPENTAIRETKEELGIDLVEAALEPHGFCSHLYPHGHVVLLFFVCRQWHGTPYGREGQAIKWLKRSALECWAGFLPASRKFLDYL